MTRTGKRRLPPLERDTAHTGATGIDNARCSNRAGISALSCVLLCLAVDARNCMAQGVITEDVERHIQNLGDADERVRAQAARDLGNVESLPKAAVSALLATLSDPSQIVGLRAADALAKVVVKEPAILREVAALLRSDRESSKMAAIRLLGSVGSVAASESHNLANCVRDDSSFDVRGKAALALARIGHADEVVLSALYAGLGDSDDDVRRCCARALNTIGPSGRALLHDGASTLAAPSRASIVIELGNRSQFRDESLTLLETALDDADPFVRSVAAQTLGDLGVTAVPVIPALVRRIEQHGDRDASVALTSIVDDARSGGISLPRHFIVSAQPMPTAAIFASVVVWFFAWARSSVANRWPRLLQFLAIMAPPTGLVLSYVSWLFSKPWVVTAYSGEVHGSLSLGGAVAATTASCCLLASIGTVTRRRPPERARQVVQLRLEEDD
jgi:HEAT repeat protein